MRPNRLFKGYRNDAFACANIRHIGEGAERRFRYAARRAEKGLVVPIVTVCYAGELNALHALSGYQELVDACRARGVELLSAMMSMSGDSSVGEGARGLALADEGHDVDG